MKILFVCKGNAERSVVAETLFNRLSKKNTAKSAGIDVLGEGGVGKGAGDITSTILLERGHDISKHSRTHITVEMFDSSDVVVLLISMKEKSLLPDYMKNSGKIRFWEIEGNDHTPKAHLERLQKIEDKVKELVTEIG